MSCTQHGVMADFIGSNVDFMDEDDPSSGNTTLPERSINGSAR